MTSFCNYRNHYDPLPRTEQKLASMTLYASTQVPVPYLVTGVPPSGEWVSSVTLVADVVNGDYDTSNNHSGWDLYSGK